MEAEVWIAVTSVSTAKEAGELARNLVAERLAACITLCGDVTSIYRWEGEIKEDRETLLVMKTSRERLQELKAAVLARHSYETPEFLAWSVPEASGAYHAWLLDALRE